MKKKTKIIWIVVASVMVAILLALTGVLLWLFVFSKKPPETADYSKVAVFMEDDFYLGDSAYSGTDLTSTFNLAVLYGKEGSTFHLAATDVASLAGDMITINKTGEFNMTVTSGETETVKNVKVIAGVNVVSLAEFVTATKAKLPAVLQADLQLSNDYDGGVYSLYANVYGNGHMIDAQPVVGESGNFSDTILTVKTVDVTVRDLHMFGKKVPDGETFNIVDMDTFGNLITFDGEGPEAAPISGTVVNCVLENANRLIAINDADVKVEGCLMRNASDSAVSVGTNNDGKSNITLKNNVMTGMAISGIIFWCMTDVTPDIFSDLTIEGFLDSYNWKERSRCQIVPRSEGLVADLANPIISSELSKSAYDGYFYKSDGYDYVHLGILIMATGDAKSNVPTINGIESINYALRDFILPGLAEKFISMCQIYGYEMNPSIQPLQQPTINLDFYKELKYGRTAA